MVGKDNVLITITTAANLGGIEQARAGLLGLNPAVLGLTLALAGAVMAGKSMIEISEKQQAAHKQLAQAVKESGGSITQADSYLKDFIDSNRAYLSDQSEVTAGYGALLRSGIPVAEAQKDMNRALDLAALKHISVSDATALLVAAEHGRTRGLIDLGITTSKYTDAQGVVINQGKNMALVMAEIDAKTAHGRDTLSETQQITNKLSNDWQDLSSRGGPPLLALLDKVLTKVDDIYQAFDRLGKDDKLWATISDRLVIMGRSIHDNILKPLQDATGIGDTSRSQQGPGGSTPFPEGPLQNVGGLSMAAGGTIQGPFPGAPVPIIAHAGEEYLGIGSARRGGGSVIHNHFNIGTFVGDGPSIDRLANEVARRLTYATGQ